MAQVYANILESLTSGLYNEINFAVREYLQNGYDSIKCARKLGVPEPIEGYCINVNITKDNRIITITDNGTGMDKSVLSEYTSIGGGTKNIPELTGHKGIGKLSGLRFFDNFRVRTKTYESSFGYELVWDSGKMMKALLNNQEKMKQIPYVDFIKDFVTINRFDCNGEENQHYTQIQLIDVFQEFRSQVTDLNIGNFIRSVFPVPFYAEGFQFSEKINSWLGDDMVQVQTYINDCVIYQFYRDTDKLVDPYFYSIKYDDKIRAKAWISWINDTSESISKSELRGIKFRCKGICVGDSNLFANNCMPSGRGPISKWFTGEIIVLDEEIKPSAARDRFYEGDASKRFFKEIMTRVGKDLSLIADIRSEISAAKQDLEKWKDNAVKAKGQFFKGIEKRIKALEKHKSRDVYDFDFSIIDNLSALLKDEENLHVSDNNLEESEIDELIEKGENKELIVKLLDLKSDEIDTHSKKTKKLIEEKIKRISLALTKQKAVKSDGLQLNKIVNILKKYLESHSLEYDLDELKEFVVKEI